jgi:hypothetical protein
MAIYQLDWVGRYDFMLYIIPLPFISLLVTRKWPFIGGVLLIVSGIVAVLLDVNYTIGVVVTATWVVGPGIGYTLVFITLPLVASGALFLISVGLKKRRIKWRDYSPFSRNPRKNMPVKD